jgi:putative ABC transport system permease protein
MISTSRSSWRWRRHPHKTRALFLVEGAIAPNPPSGVDAVGHLRQNVLWRHRPVCDCPKPRRQRLEKLSRTLQVVDEQLKLLPRVELEHLAARLNDGSIDRFVERLRAVPGVTAVIGDQSAAVEVLTIGGRPVHAPVAAHPWPAAKLMPDHLVSGRAPRKADEAMLEAGPALVAHDLGQHIGVLTADGVQQLTVVGIAASSAAASSSVEPRLFVTPTVAAGWTGTPAYDAIGVIAKPGTKLQSLVTGLRRTITEPGIEVDLRGGGLDLTKNAQFAGMLGLFTLMAIIAGFAAIFVVASTFALAVTHRRREIGLQRAAGATPAQVRLLIATESLAIALASSALGMPLGLLLALGFGRMLVEAGLAPASLRVTYGLVPPLIAAAVALLTSQIAVLAAARRASRIPPSAALVEASVPRRSGGRARLGLGLGVFGLGLVMWLVAPRAGAEIGEVVAVFSALVVVTAFGILGSWLVAPLAWLVGTLIRRPLGVSGWLAREDNSVQNGRVTSIAMPVMITVTLGTALLFTTASLAATSRAEQLARVRADYVVSPVGPLGLPPASPQAPLSSVTTQGEASGASSFRGLESIRALLRSCCVYRWSRGVRSSIQAESWLPRPMPSSSTGESGRQ